MFEEIRDQFFPCQLTETITVHSKTTTELWKDAGPIFSKVFDSLEEIGCFPMPKDRQHNLKPLASAFAQSHHEHFVFYDGDTPIGWSWGDMKDEMTFFMTSTGILPSYQRRGIYTMFLQQLLAYLHELGYERVTSKHQVNNRAIIIAKLKAGFLISGMDLDERWGSQIEMMYFFHEDRVRGFETANSVYHVPITNMHMKE